MFVLAVYTMKPDKIQVCVALPSPCASRWRYITALSLTETGDHVVDHLVFDLVLSQVHLSSACSVPGR